MVTEDRPSNLSTENSAKNNTGDLDSWRAVLSSQVNYCTSALYPGEKPDLEILSSSFMKLLKVTLGQSQTTLNRI